MRTLHRRGREGRPAPDQPDLCSPLRMPCDWSDILRSGFLPPLAKKLSSSSEGDCEGGTRTHAGQGSARCSTVVQALNALF